LPGLHILISLQFPARCCPGGPYQSWNGFLRGVAAAQRRAQRDSERRARLQARAQKLQDKLDELEHARAEAEEFEERINQLTTAHHQVGEGVDWISLKNTPAQPEPQKKSRWEDAAVLAHKEYKPTLWQRLFGKEKDIRAGLESAIVEARQKDENSYQGALKIHRGHLEEWQQSNHMARAILAGDLNAYKSAYGELDPLSEMKEFGCHLIVSFPDRNSALVSISVESEKVVPSESKSLTRSGKLSIKSIPQSKFNELYQDYVCGCALRAARELFCCLPLSRVIVNANALLLDSSTGHLREQTILSVGITRSTFDRMAFESVDPSDAMKLFSHRMGFKRSQGFFAIQPLLPDEYPTIDP